MAATVADGSCNASAWRQRTYTDKCKAHDVKTQPGNVSDAAACCAACAAEPSCKIFVFCEAGAEACMKKQDHTANCKLCATGGTTSSVPGATSGTLHGGGPPSPAPGPSPPHPSPPPYPPTPVPPPGPKPVPVLGYRPHIIFNLVDDVGHYNFGWRGNPEARTPNIDHLVENGLILDRHCVCTGPCPPLSACLP
jgi:hypothetical protein